MLQFETIWAYKLKWKVFKLMKLFFCGSIRFAMELVLLRKPETPPTREDAI